MAKAFGYMRVSGRGQVDGDGFPRQRAAIERFAAANGYQIVQWFEERGVSGTIDGLDRPTWSEMMAATNGVKTVIIERLDRLARDLMVQETAVVGCVRAGITVVSTAEPDLCSADPTRIVMRQILGAFAQYEKSMLVRKLRVARDRQRKVTGKVEGPKFYGCDRKRPGEAGTLELIRGMHAEGDDAKTIAERLNEAGVKPRKAARWSWQSIALIVERFAPLALTLPSR